MLIYTGQRRLAKNLLRNIMNGYIKSDNLVVETINNIKNTAKEMEKAIDCDNVEEFIKLLNQGWDLAKKLDSGCTNSCINEIVKSCEDLIDGKMICGAGGGGFLQVILKENVKKEELESRINEVFQDCGIKVYDVELVEELWV